ncbi:MAG: hypothetical protein HOV87_30020 [Catenulispora sp.]|nr:hypothetical protein [Catenulispora sp.]
MSTTHILVNNAGTIRRSPAAQHSDADCDLERQEHGGHGGHGERRPALAQLHGEGMVDLLR